MTYKFEQFDVEITNPTIEVVRVGDNVKNKTCDVTLLLTTDTAKFGVTLSGFSYSKTWEDDDIYEWVINELTNYAA
jgi:hypothetical protein